jgi:hypothetical protein
MVRYRRRAIRGIQSDTTASSPETAAVHRHLRAGSGIFSARSSPGGSDAPCWQQRRGARMRQLLGDRWAVLVLSMPSLSADTVQFTSSFESPRRSASSCRGLPTPPPSISATDCAARADPAGRQDRPERRVIARSRAIRPRSVRSATRPIPSPRQCGAEWRTAALPRLSARLLGETFNVSNAIAVFRGS